MNNNAPKVGDRAPDFTVKRDGGANVSLYDFRGKKNVVLFFYPKDFTFSCTREACAFRDSFDELTKHDAELFGVSYDDEESHAKFIKKHNLPFPLISDKDKSISKAYGTANRLGGLLPGTKRATFQATRIAKSPSSRTATTTCRLAEAA